MSECSVRLVQKRDGRIVPFDQDKITNAIFKAAQSVGGDDRERALFISNAVVEMLEERFGASQVPTVEDIQDLAERALIKHGHAKTAKAYILYRDLHNKLRDIRALIDANELVEGYLQHLDWRVNENSNMSFSLQGLNNHIFTAVNSAYWLNRLYPSECAMRTSMAISTSTTSTFWPCTAVVDLRGLLIHGFGGVQARSVSAAQALARRWARSSTFSTPSRASRPVRWPTLALTPFWPPLSVTTASRPASAPGAAEFIYNMNVPTRAFRRRSPI